MQILLSATLILAGVIHLLPVSGALGGEALASLYGIAVDDRNLEILMRHRAILFGILGGALLHAACSPRLRGAAILAGLASAVSFLGIALQVGGYNSTLYRVVWADLIAVLCLMIAGMLHLRSSRLVVPAPAA
jgi:hypothetical protein